MGRNQAVTTYTYAQLEQIWINNGGSKATAPIAAAIAEAESSGNSAATSANPDGGTNAGLWQLDTPGGVGAGYSVAQLQDPNLNATVAINGSSGGSDWSDWATFASGAYKAFLSNSTAPDPNVPAASGGGATAAGGGGTGASSPGCLVGINGLGINQCFLDKSQARAMIGAGLIVGAAAFLMLPGIIILGAAGFRGASAGRAIADAAGPLEQAPGYGRAIRSVRSRSENRAARKSGARTERIRQQRAAGVQAQRRKGPAPQKPATQSARKPPASSQWPNKNPRKKPPAKKPPAGP